MKKLEQKGFSVVEGLLIAGIVAILGFIGWYVHQQSQKQDETSQPQSSTTTAESTDSDDSTSASQAAIESTTSSADTENWKTYTRYGVTFKYPADWSLKANDNSQSSSTMLTSPDYVSDDSSTTGESITVDEAQFKQSGLTAENFKTNHLDAGPNEYSAYKLLSIDGEKAVQYYRGDSRTTVFFVGEKTITLVLDTFPDRDAASSTYDKVIGTVTIN